MANAIISGQIISEDEITQNKKHLPKTGWCVKQSNMFRTWEGVMAAAFEASCRV